MRNLFILLMCIFTYSNIFAQDNIILKNGEEVKSKVLEITTSEIKYKKFDNQNGPIFTILKSEVLMVRYENGTKDIFTESNKSTEKTASIDDSRTKVPQDAIAKEHAYSFNKDGKNSRTKVPQDAITNHKYKNRISLNIGYGSGFKSVPIVTFTDGTEASISFGGGTVGKFEYGYEFNRHFDLAFGIGAQFGELDKSADNGSIKFNRSIISLTPSYILPIDSRGNTRLKFGVGIDWLYNAELNIDITGVAKDDWKYNGTIGEHLSIICEINSLKRFSYNAGLKLYNAKYTFKPGSDSYPTVDDLKSPDGSGIDLLFGVNYHF